MSVSTEYICASSYCLSVSMAGVGQLTHSDKQRHRQEFTLQVWINLNSILQRRINIQISFLILLSSYHLLDTVDIIYS